MQPTTHNRLQTVPFAILPFGPIPEILSKSVAAHIQAYLNLDTDILPPFPSPDYALDEKRFQFNAALIIERIEQEASRRHSKILGIVDTDLFIPIFTHVLGEARQGGAAAVISTYRLQENRDRKVPPSALTLERSAKIALHEASHLFNLSHCLDEKCLMHFSGSLEDLDKLPLVYCRYCSAYLRESMGRFRI